MFLIASCDLSAQAYRNETSRKYASSSKSKKKLKERAYHDNLIKLNLSSLVFKSIGLQYERKIARKKSLAIGFIYRPKGSWFLSKFYDTTNASTGISQETRFMYTSSKFSTFMFTPEFRYYLSRQAPRGLYLAAFLRTRFDKTSFNYHYYEDNNITQKIGLANLNETMIGGGIMLGLQLITRKNISIDLWFVGPWVFNKSVKLESKVNTTNISELQQKFLSQDMKPWLERFSFNEDDFTKGEDVRWNANGVMTKFNYVSVGARFVGINIAYNF